VIDKSFLQTLRLKTRQQIRESVLEGDWSISVDFASYFDQFKLATPIADRLVFEHYGELFNLLVLPMGLRSSVEVAQAGTWVIVSGLSSKYHVVIDTLTDNVRFVGTKEAVTDAAWEFILRCRRVRAVLNEINVATCTREDVEKLAVQQHDFLGEHFCYRTGRVRSTSKIMDKVQHSWERRHEWSSRNFAAHVALLLYASDTLDESPGKYWHAMQLLRDFGRVLQAEPDLWDTPFPGLPGSTLRGKIPSSSVSISELTFKQLSAWTNVILANEWTPIQKTVPFVADIEAVTDASDQFGWGLLGRIHGSGETFSFASPFSAHWMRIP
jgi:hypothetical protein